MAISHCEEFKIASRFIANYQKDWSKPFGGNDHAAFEGFCSGVRLWGRADIKNRPAALLMLRGAVLAMQEHNATAPTSPSSRFSTGRSQGH